MMRSKSRRAALDDVDVAVGQRIERAGIDREARALAGCSCVERSAALSPDVHRFGSMRECRPGAGGVTRAACSSTQRRPSLRWLCRVADRVRRPARSRTADRARRCRTGRRERRRQRAPTASRMITQRSRTPQRAAFSAISRAARRSCSMNVRRVGAAAERLEPIAPVPANTSSTRAPGTRGARMLNSVSRSLSEVGRRPSHVGAFSVRPFMRAGDDAHVDRPSASPSDTQPTVIRPNCRCQTLRT